MKHNGVVLAARPARIFLSPRKRAASRRLPITLWQTHSWMKKIIKLGNARKAERRLRPCAESYGGSSGIR